jgi:membrane protease YdiL (CAAX protease family)
MQINDGPAVESATERQTLKPIASWGHLVGFLAIQAGFLAIGLIDFGPAQSAGDAATARLLGQYPVTTLVALYLAMIPIEFALLIYCLTGVRSRGGNLETLSGGRWTSWKDIVADLCVALPFWLVLQVLTWIASRVLGPESVDSVGLLPKKLPEILAWIAVSITAGVCEELIYRGYLQQQLHALAGNLPFAILGQGLVFGLVHCYQGWKSTIVACVIGVLLGALAAWRRNLRANVIVHAWIDIWEGWLKFAI